RAWPRWLEALTGRLSDMHTVSAPTVARHVIEDLGFTPSRVMIVPSGLDLAAIDAQPPLERAEIGVPPEVPLIAWVGRMDPVKDLDTWIDVFDRLRQRRAVAGVLLGDGPARGRVERILRECDLLGSDGDMVGRIQIKGWSNDVVRSLKSADLFLFTSRTEGHPNAVLEAMACRCCVVA